MPVAIAVFGLSVLFVLYTLAGYPLLLRMLAARRRQPVRRGAFEPRVSVIVAVHNGEAYLREKILSIFALDYPRDLMEILIASDGSTDATDSIARSFAGEGVILLQLPRGGKPAALNAAVAASQGEILVFTDVRQTLAPDSLRLMLENFHDPAVGSVSAELVIRDGQNREERNVGLYWRYEFWIRVQLSRMDSIFGATGAYYALRRDLAVPIPTNALLDDMHLPLAAFFRGYRLIVDERARMFDYSTNLQAEFRRKVRTLAGNYQILMEYPGLLTWRNRLWLHFVSYKFARLILPFALIAALISSVFLPAPWNWLMFTGQVLFYCLAILDPWIPEGPLKKATSPLRTFVTLMSAALLAVSIFFVPSTTLWKTGNYKRPSAG